jgi:hypothetical protein
MSIDMSSLLEEMDSMPSFDMPKRTTAEKPGAKGTSSATGKDANAMGVLAPTQTSTLRQRDNVTKTTTKKKGKKKSTVPKHKTWGECPVDIMADFLTFVQAGKLDEALKLSNKILEHEPDNPLIKMYQESLRELIVAKKAEEKKEKDSDDEAEQEERENFLTFSNITGEAASEDEAASDSDSDSDDDEALDGVAEKKVEDDYDNDSQSKRERKGYK